MMNMTRHLFSWKRYYLLLGIVMTFNISSCSKKAIEVVAPSPLLTQKKPFTSADATAAFDSFNNTYYSATDKLYFENTEKKAIGAIWTQAIYWDIVMNTYQRTKSPADLKMINDIYTGGYIRYDGYNWNNTTTWFIYDDMMWWVIALTNAYQITGNTIYLDKAKAGFDRVWNGSYDPAAGGMFWDFQHSGKNSCINYPTVIAAMKLYAATKNEVYFTKATSIYAWSRTNLFDTKSGRVADNKIGNVPGYSDYTYNYGTCIGSAMALYKATGAQNYLDDAKLCANYVKNTMSDSNGILPAEGDYNEQGVLKAIFAQYLVQLLPEDASGQYAKWIDTNINAAWQNRDQSRGIMYRNYKTACPAGIVQSYESSSAVAFMQLFNPI